MDGRIGKGREYRKAVAEVRGHMESSDFGWRLRHGEWEGLRVIACADAVRFPDDPAAARTIQVAIALDGHGRPVVFGVGLDGRTDGDVLPLFEARGSSVGELMLEAERRCAAAVCRPCDALRGPAMGPLLFYVVSSLRACADGARPWARTDGGSDRYGVVWTLRAPDGSGTFSVELAEGGLAMLSVGDADAPRYEVMDMGRGVRDVEFFDDVVAAMDAAERQYDRDSVPGGFAPGEAR